MVLVYSAVLQRAWLGLVRGAEDALEFAASCDVGIASGFVEGAFESKADSARDERDFSIRSQLNPIFVAAAAAVVVVVGVVVVVKFRVVVER